ncbi:uncharacterized protein LOC116259926 isoform X1 [Nymphaea colorata]|nr:uncharacterized protein LOC116259926 isoform X1 [Nymphaea colorata]
MAGKNPACTVFIGNLDEKVSERVLYEIMIQAGRIVDLYVPKDKETNRPKGFAFTEYESEEIAEYAVKLFSGLVSLHKRTLRFAISGQDKRPANNLATTVNKTSDLPHLSTPSQNVNIQQQSTQVMTPCRFSAYPQYNFPPASSPEVVSNGYRTGISSYGYNGNDNLHTPLSKGLGAHVNRSGSEYISRHPTSFPSY